MLAAGQRLRQDPHLELTPDEQVLASRAQRKSETGNRVVQEARRARADVLGGWHCVHPGCTERFDTKEGYWVHQVESHGAHKGMPVYPLWRKGSSDLALEAIPRKKEDREEPFRMYSKCHVCSCKILNVMPS